MKIITDGFKAMDAMQYAVDEGCTITATKNTITITERLIPKMKLCQIRTKSLDVDTLKYIQDKFLTPTSTMEDKTIEEKYLDWCKTQDAMIDPLDAEKYFYTASLKDVEGLIDAEIKRIEGNGHTVLTVSKVNTLTDLLTQIQALKK